MPIFGGALSGKTCSNLICHPAASMKIQSQGEGTWAASTDLWCGVRGPLVPGMVHITLLWECGVDGSWELCSFCELCVDRHAHMYLHCFCV